VVHRILQGWCTGSYRTIVQDNTGVVHIIGRAHLLEWLCTGFHMSAAYGSKGLLHKVHTVLQFYTGDEQSTTEVVHNAGGVPQGFRGLVYRVLQEWSTIFHWSGEQGILRCCPVYCRCGV